MGGLVKTLFGGSSSKSTQQSGNQAYPWLQSNFGSGAASAYNGGLGALSGILTGNSAQSQQALQNFWNSAGGQFQLNQGINDVNANMAARGLGTSGADMKGLENYRSGLAGTMMQQYLGDLGNMTQLGLGGAQLVGNAGYQSSGSSKGSSSNGGLGSFLGAALSFI